MSKDNSISKLAQAELLMGIEPGANYHAILMSAFKYVQFIKTKKDEPVHQVGSASEPLGELFEANEGQPAIVVNGKTIMGFYEDSWTEIIGIAKSFENKERQAHNEPELATDKYNYPLP